MAIKVNGTTVIDDSRNLSNIAGGLKTVNNTSLIGSGNISAGASTDLGAVGTYAFLFRNGNHTQGDTIAGSSLTYVGFSSSGDAMGDQNLLSLYLTGNGGSPSGTWRIMSRNRYTQSGTFNQGPVIAVRIS